MQIKQSEFGAEEGEVNKKWSKKKKQENTQSSPLRFYFKTFSVDLSVLILLCSFKWK